MIQHELERIVVCPDGEVSAAEVGTPVANRLDEPNQLGFVCGELEMSSRERTTEEGTGAIALMQDRAEARARRVVVHREGVGEIQ